jgi:5-methylcytosine-specific restriction enzyme A
LGEEAMGDTPLSAFLYTWNPNRWSWNDQKNAIVRIKNGNEYKRRWSCGNTKRIEIGDLFFLMRLADNPKGIIGCGYVLSQPREGDHWDEEKAAEGKSTLSTKLWFKALSDDPIISLAYLEDQYPNQKWTPQASGISIPDEIAQELFTRIQSDENRYFVPSSKQEIQLFEEGRRRYVTHLRAERSKGAVQALKSNEAWICDICGEDFFVKYGVKYIEAHHKIPVSTYSSSHTVRLSEFALLCPNCHKAVHIYMKKDGYDYAEIKKILGNRN